MEAVGVALGATPLLIELFKQTVDAYKLFLEGRNLEKSITHFKVMLDIEERRLLQWGENSGFRQGSGQRSTASKFEPGSALFRNQDLLEIIENIFHCIIDILGDVERLKAKYGLDVHIPNHAGALAGPSSTIVSGNISGDNDVPELGATPAPTRKRKFTEEFSIQKKTKLGFTRFQWAIKDREKFEKLLTDLKHYNDSLHNLHRPETEASISRDTLASLINTASMETLRVMCSLTTPESRASSSTELTTSVFANVPTAASIALQIRARVESQEYYSVRPNVTIIPAAELEGPLRSWRNTDLQWLSWKNSSGLAPESMCLVLEETLCWEESMSSRPEVDTFRSAVEGVATLLHHANSEPAFRTMEFLGIVPKYPKYKTSKGDNSRHLFLAYKLPPGADRNLGPEDLTAIISSSLGSRRTRQPALDDRLGLARSLVSATFQLHSSGWMHKNISSDSIVFFRDTRVELQENDAFIRYPYVHGFTPFSRIGSSMRFDKSETEEHLEEFRSKIHLHPSYIFHKAVDSFQLCDFTTTHGKTYYRFRHDYYSLGLVLLQIGLWIPLANMEGIFSAKHAAKLQQCDKRKKWKVNHSAFLAEPDLGLNHEECAEPDLGLKHEECHDTPPPSSPASTPPYVSDHDDDDEASSCSCSELAMCVRDLMAAVDEEQMQGIIDYMSLDHDTEDIQDRVPRNDRTRQGYSFWDFWVRTEIYFHAVFRREAIKLAETSLASTMGRRYQQVVLRCLKSRFDLPYTASEADWLKAFNWLAVNELEELRL